MTAASSARSRCTPAGAPSSGSCTTPSISAIASAWSATATTTRAGPGRLARRRPVRRDRRPHLLPDAKARPADPVRDPAPAPPLRHHRHAPLSRCPGAPAGRCPAASTTIPQLGPTAARPAARAMMGDIVRRPRARSILEVDAAGLGAARAHRACSTARSRSPPIAATREPARRAASACCSRVPSIAAAAARFFGRATRAWSATASSAPRRSTCSTPTSRCGSRPMAPGVDFDTVTTGNFCGFDLWLADAHAGEIDLRDRGRRRPVPIAEIGLEDLVVDAGGLGRRLRLFRLPDRQSRPGSMRFAQPVRLRAGRQSALCPPHPGGRPPGLVEPDLRDRGVGMAAVASRPARRQGRADHRGGAPDRPGDGAALAGQGAAIVVNTRSAREEAEAVAAEIEAQGGQALVQIADVTDEAAVQAMVDAALARFCRLDILVSNAADRKRRRSPRSASPSGITSPGSSSMARFCAPGPACRR